MAHFIMLPQQSKTTTIIVEFIYQNTEQIILQVVSRYWLMQYYLATALCGSYWIVLDLLTSFIPLSMIYIAIWLWSMSTYAVLSWFWWIQLIMAYVDSGRSIRNIFKDPSMSYLRRDYVSSLHIDSRKSVRSKIENANEILRKDICFWNECTATAWTDSMRVIGCSQRVGNGFYYLSDFCICTLSLGASFMYFLGRLILYRIGYLKADKPPKIRRRRRCKSHRRRYRRKNNYKKKRRYHRPKKKKQRRCIRTDCHPCTSDTTSNVAFTTVFNVDERVARRNNETLSHDSDSTTMVCDNSANVHICNNRSMFVGELQHVTNHKVATIGGRGHPASGIGTVRWIWTDDFGVKHTNLIHDVLYFPQSPINILSVTSFAKQLKDSEGTGIDTKMAYSRFYWDFGKYQRIIHHPPSNLPEMTINEGFSFATMYRALVSKVINPSISHQRSCCMTNLEESTAHTCCHDVHASTSSFDLETELYEVGETLFYTKDGYSSLVKVKSFSLDDDNILSFVVVNSNEDEIVTTREYLRSPSNPDIGWIPTSVPEYQTASTRLSEEEIEEITSPIHLSPIQQEFLSMHYKLLHLPFSIMLRLAKFGVLPKRFLKLRNDLPPCISCTFGQAHRRPWRHKASAKSTGGVLRSSEITEPGQTVGTDQLVSAQPGLVPQVKGKLTRARIWGATIFIDYSSRWVNVQLMQDATGESTMDAKLSFEQASATRGVSPKHYHADNGRFAESLFTKDCNAKLQKLTFCGVGAHHQNGVAENSIKQLTLTSRTILLHAQRHWPEYITTMMWPFALLAAADRMNNLHIDMDGLTPEMKFSKATGMKTRLNEFHTFGCPVYILDARLQSAGGPGPPKWDPRARLGIYVGHSPIHAGSVALVLNPKTGLVSPQYHVVFDDDFSTVPNLRANTVPENWAQLVKNSCCKSVDGFYDVTKTWFNGISDPSAGTDIPNQSNQSNTQAATHSQVNAPVDAPFGSTTDSEDTLNGSENTVADFSLDSAGLLPSEGGPDISPSEGISQPTLPIVPTMDQDEFDATMNQDDIDTLCFDETSHMPPIVDLSSSGLRRSRRIAGKKPEKHHAISFFTKICALGLVLTTSLWSSEPSYLYSSAQNLAFATVNSFHAANQSFDGTLNGIHHMALLAGKENNESYTFKEMIKQEDAADFIQAMIKEADDHETRNHWTVVPRSAKPPEVRTIMAIWSFKRKRFPDGRLNKHKARLCAHGGQQQWGVNYWETYAPTVNWISVRFLLVIAEILNLDTKAIDFVLAFPQADLEVPVYMELPAGMELAGHGNESSRFILRLNYSLYGLKNASYNWHNMLRTALLERGFVESLSDPCVFISENMVVLVYVDDCILITKESSAMDTFIDSLKNGPEKFVFTDEGKMSSYLGVDISRLPDNDGFKLSQPFLIERIIQAVNFDMSATKGARDNVPAGYPLLSKDENGPPRKAPWKYRSIVGMLGYLQGTSRPDISFAVHQCARFNNNPKLSHERAIKRIVRYLLDTKDEGLIYKPDKSKGLECYVDADFAGGWKDGEQDSPESVLSRTGFVIMYAGCPITWCSKLQTEIALSTTESEYIALSSSMREVIPFLNLMKETAELFGLLTKKPLFKCTVWEDNESCITVAKSPKFTPRTKHIAIKYHHFRSFVSNGTIIINSIDTKEQLADIFTKPLPEKSFRHLRRQFMGW